MQNYAGDLALPGPRAIVRTINVVFPSCRIFREFPAEDPISVAANAGTSSDFTNMVIFCKKKAGALTFRAATERDMLNSYARREFLEPKYEMDVVEFLGAGEEEGEKEKQKEKKHGAILRQNDTAIVTKSHETSARGHWSIMRRVLPGVVWEKW